jgi:hypothetical protein
MSVVTQLYFQVVEEISYKFRLFFWVGHHQFETRISEKTGMMPPKIPYMMTLGIGS